MKHTFVIIFSVFFVCNASLYARQSKKDAVDSMIKILPQFKEDTNKVLLLDRISYFSASFNTEQGFKYSKTELDLATKLNWVKGKGHANKAIGRNYIMSDDMANGVKYYELAIKYFEEAGDEIDVSRVYGNLGNLYDEQSNYTKALECDFKALKIAEKLNNTDAIIADLGNIGVIYHEMKKYATSIDYYTKGLKIAKQINDSNQMGVMLGNMGNVYHHWNAADNEDKALEFDKKALDIYKAIDDKHGIALNMGNMASVYIALDQYDSAIKYGLSAMKINEEIGNKHSIGTNSGSIGEAVSKLGMNNTVFSSKNNVLGVRSKADALKLAYDYFTKANNIFLQTGDIEASISSYKYLYEIDTMRGDYKSAFKNMEEYILLKDSLSVINDQEKIGAIETERALLVKEKQIEADEKKSLERKFYITVLCLLLLIIIIVARNFIHQRKLTSEKTKLADQKEDLLQQKEVLIKEIHHRVKNNLQVVVSLLDMQTGKTSDDVAKKTMTESAARVKSISLIHRFLYQHEDVTGIEYAHFVKELFTQVVAVFKKPGQNIVLDEQVPETVLDIDTAVPLGLILNELLINSFKYAFEDADGAINITLVQNRENYELTYSDSGKGLGENYEIKRATTMGMTIMRNLSKQVGGSISYQYEQNTFAIVFKDLLGRKKIK